MRQAQHRTFRYTSFFLILSFCASIAWAKNDPPYTSSLKGDSIKAGKVISVADSVFYNSTLKPTILRTNSVNNVISFRINEYSDVVLPDSFKVELKTRIYYTNNNNLRDSIKEKIFTIDYNRFRSYKARDIYFLQNAYRIDVKVMSVTVTYASADKVLSLLELENKMVINRDYVMNPVSGTTMNCSANAIRQINADVNTIPVYGELKIYWTPSQVIEKYDVEWTFIDKSALDAGRYNKDGLLNANLIFKNNATRVTTTADTCMIPMLYDGQGSLFYRIRGVQEDPSGELITTLWSSDAGALGRYDFTGHEPSLNWQATTSFAEEAKRKSVVQYFDGSLRARQTVTRDNTTQTTIVAETFYDKQGRPAIQVLPAPTLSKLIGFTPGLNVFDVNSREYDKGIYDTVLTADDYCSKGADSMSVVSGTSNYYSPLNLLKDESFNQYIPDAKGYAFTETQYTQDNTGRISKQGGVGKDFQLGSGHETKYYYGTPEQTDLDALFGTEVGEASHYQKNMVRDANGQYSVSYVDMHGRTIATALAGDSARGLQRLKSYRDSIQTESLLNSTNNNIIGNRIESSKSLLVTMAGNHKFTYGLAAESLTLQDCKQQNICYDCLYDLTITITDDCNNQLLGGSPVVVKKSNFKLFQIDTTCDLAIPVDTSFSRWLEPGSYTITKVLSISQAGMQYYRDSIFLAHNTCQSYEDILKEEKDSVRAGLICNAPDEIHYEYESYREDMLQDLYPLTGQYATIPPYDTCYTIFNNVNNDYQNSGINYLDENGDPAMVTNSVGQLVKPQQLSRDEFIDNFQPSWANALLPFHPEYKTLQAYESFSESLKWDEEFSKVKTYAEAKAKGYLNPTGNTTQTPASGFGVLNTDPLLTQYAISSTARTAIENKLFNYFTQLTTGNVSLWGMATAQAKCPNARPIDQTCVMQWNGAGNPFNESALCTGELDMAWKFFQSQYLSIKHDWLVTYCIASSGTSQNLSPCRPNFITSAQALQQSGYSSNNDLTADSIKTYNDANQFFDDNCRAYATRWWQQLQTPCNYDKVQDSALIISYLVDVCRNGTDFDHPYGSSTVKPGSNARFKSFEEVIKFYNDSTGRTIDLNCNAYLIDKPLPYDYSAPLVTQQIFSKPDSCTSAKVISFYKEYTSQASLYINFSDFMLKRYHTKISQGSLDTLVRLCTDSISCKYLPQPINLPPLFQCAVSHPCIECTQYNQAYNKFKALFPGVEPSFEEPDTVQQKKNALFANYMNQQFGFTKTAADYLDFKAQCDSAGITSAFTSDSLQATITAFKNYYSAIEKGQVYNGYKLSQAAIEMTNAADAVLKARHGNTLPAGYAMSNFTSNFDAKLQSVIKTVNGYYHAIVPFPLNNINVGASYPELQSVSVLPRDFVSGTATTDQLSRKYYATVVNDWSNCFQQMWSSKNSGGSYAYYGLSTPLAKYLPSVAPENHVFNFAFYKIPSSVTDASQFEQFYRDSVNLPNVGYNSRYVLDNANVKSVTNPRLATQFIYSTENTSCWTTTARGVKVTLELMDGTTTDAYMYGTYDCTGYVYYKENADSNLYNPDCSKAFAYYFNQQIGTNYTASQIDSIYSANNVEATYCSQGSCQSIVVASSGEPKPEPVTCQQLITTYKNFMADFPHPEKGAIVKAPATSTRLSLNTMSVQSLSIDGTSNTIDTTQQLPVIDSVPPVADSIQVATDQIQQSSANESLSMQSMSVSPTFVQDPPLVDTYLQGRELLEWYFNTHLGLTGYTYENFMDWLVNGCGYKLHQLPLDDKAAVCCDTLQTLLDSFKLKYPDSLGAVITETATVPVHKVSHLIRYYSTSGVFSSEATSPSGAALSAQTWTSSGKWLIIRDNVSFNFNVLPQNATINNASFNLYAKPEHIEFFPCCGAHYRQRTDSVYGIFERVTGIIVPGQTLPSAQPATDTLHRLTIAPISISNGASGGSDLYSNENYLNQPCTALVKDLYQQASDNHNYGIIFKINKENLAYKAYNFWGITSYTTAGKLPNLQVNYTASRCDVFASYINNALGTHLTNEQITALYNKCGVYQTPCGITTPPEPPVMNGPRLCGAEAVDEIITEVQEDQCADSTGMAIIRATERYRLYKDSLTGSFTEAYQQKCLNAINLESFTVEHPVSEYHYTLYYYDQAGNLIKTVSPEGVHPNRDLQWLKQVATNRQQGTPLVPQHTLVTTYRYNSLNQVVTQQSPDGGYTEFWYDRLGRLVVSRNAKQKAESKWSYTLYDALGRITEVGQKVQATVMTNIIARDPQALSAWLKAVYRNENNSRCVAEQVTTTVYDLADAVTAGLSKPIPFVQKSYTLRNRVSYTRTYDYLYAANLTNLPVYGTYNYSTLYSYDIHGNVDSLMQYYRSGVMSAQGNNRFKVIAYKYDLISGKVNEVHYQPTQADQLYHRYVYDADNRLTDVYTSDNKMLLNDVNLAEHDARYDYYKHGPLARIVLGTQQVQGLDYAYTLQGWLKGVNATALNPAFDMGGDGKTKGVAKDAFGFNLNYFAGDYASISGKNPFPGNSGYLPAGAYKPLYNGNISSMAVSIDKLNGTQLYNYSYDQLNRLIGMDTYRGFDSVANNWNGLVYTPDYGEKVSYDANGNILSYLRNGNAARLNMDNMDYSYKLGTNQLDKVVDKAPDVSAGEYDKYNDVKQGQTDGNYQYDAIGNLIKENSEKITNITWSVYGKILSITKAAANSGDVQTINYTYDAAGNRISKEVIKKSFAASAITWYVRDGSGNVMAVYSYSGASLSNGTLYLTEQHLYGSSRIGVWNRNIDMSSSSSNSINVPLLGLTYSNALERGEKMYELTNHLGNVLMTISDKKMGHDAGNETIDYYTADVLSAQDFYPFGMMMHGRKYEHDAKNPYRYSINGQEKELGLNENITSAFYWEYDSRIGRRWNIDPSPKAYESYYSAFANNPVKYVDPNGADTINVKSRVYDAQGRKSGDKGFDSKNMMTLFTVYTPERHELDNGDKYELKYDMFASDFNKKYSLNAEWAFHSRIDGGKSYNVGRLGTRVLSVNINPNLSKAINFSTVDAIEKFRATAVEAIKKRWLSPLNIDKLVLFGNGSTYDVKDKLLHGYQYTYIQGVGLFESDYIGNLVYGAVMSRFQSLTGSLTDGDFLQDRGYDDVFDSHAIIVGHFEGGTKITATTFQKVNRYNLYKTTEIQGKIYNTYEIENRDNKKEYELKTNN